MSMSLWFLASLGDSRWSCGFSKTFYFPIESFYWPTFFLMTQKNIFSFNIQKPPFLIISPNVILLIFCDFSSSDDFFVAILQLFICPTGLPDNFASGFVRIVGIVTKMIKAWNVVHFVTKMMGVWILSRFFCPDDVRVLNYVHIVDLCQLWSLLPSSVQHRFLSEKCSRFWLKSVKKLVIARCHCYIMTSSSHDDVTFTYYVTQRILTSRRRAYENDSIFVRVALPWRHFDRRPVC